MGRIGKETLSGTKNLLSILGHPGLGLSSFWPTACSITCLWDDAEGLVQVPLHAQRRILPRKVGVLERVVGQQQVASLAKASPTPKKVVAQKTVVVRVVCP